MTSRGLIRAQFYRYEYDDLATSGSDSFYQIQCRNTGTETRVCIARLKILEEDENFLGFLF